MDFSVSREPVYVSEVLLDSQAEQGVEFDYVLPDYYPDIFKILKCSLKPRVVSCSVNGDKLVCDGIVNITVLYLSEGSTKLNAVEHRYTYSKTVDMPRAAQDCNVNVTATTDYCNCRAISGRRLDVRGAVSLKIKATCITSAEIITDAKGCGIETKKEAYVYGGKQLRSEKRFTVREELEAGDSMGNVKAVISTSVYTTSTDCRVIADKVVLKSEARIKAVYICDEGDNTGVHTLEADIPISRILDIPGISEKHYCNARLSVISAELTPKGGEEGSRLYFELDMTVDASAVAGLEETICPVVDMYSTMYEGEAERIQIKSETEPMSISQSAILKLELDYGQGEIESIYDCGCELSNISVQKNSDEEFTLCGQAVYYAIAVVEGYPVCIDKTTPFTLAVKSPLPQGEIVIDPFIQVSDVGCNMQSENSVELRVSINVQGYAKRIVTLGAVKNITLDEKSPKEHTGDYTLKLYFMQGNEDIWSIAKKYNTSAENVCSEDDSKMLLIPML